VCQLVISSAAVLGTAPGSHRLKAT
jgi:hypothetical protein